MILPKLFRRLAEYLTLDETGGVDPQGFRAFLAAHNDRLFTVPPARPPASTLSSRSAARPCTLTLAPDQIVFIEA